MRRQRWNRSKIKQFNFEDTDKIWRYQRITNIGIFEITPGGKTTQWIFTYRAVQGGWKSYGSSRRMHSHPMPSFSNSVQETYTVAMPLTAFFPGSGRYYIPRLRRYYFVCGIRFVRHKQTRHRYGVYPLRFSRLLAPWPSEREHVYFYFTTSRTFFPNSFNLRARIPGGKWVITRAHTEWASYLYEKLGPCCNRKLKKKTYNHWSLKLRGSFSGI